MTSIDGGAIACRAFKKHMPIAPLVCWKLNVPSAWVEASVDLGNRVAGVADVDVEVHRPDDGPTYRTKRRD